MEQACSEQPLDYEIIILSVKNGPGKNEINGEYARQKNRKARAGELIIETRGDLIVNTTVRYER